MFEWIHFFQWLNHNGNSNIQTNKLHTQSISVWKLIKLKYVSNVWLEIKDTFVLIDHVINETWFYISTKSPCYFIFQSFTLYVSCYFARLLQSFIFIIRCYVGSAIQNLRRYWITFFLFKTTLPSLLKNL